MQHESEHDLIPAWQDGNLGAARQIVSMLQSEAINVSYLLTGERDSSIALSETAMVSLLNQIRSGDPDVDLRVRLLNLIGHSYLRGDYKERERPESTGLLLEPAPARFNVDDRRTLLLAALSRLDARERTVLVLRDFCGLETSEITRLQERKGEPLVAPMETARQRIRQSVDIPAGDPLRPTFVEATFSAPRVDLWARLESEITAIQQRGRNQSRLISAAIVTVVAVILIGVTLAFLGGDGDGPADDTLGAVPTSVMPELPAGPTVGQSIDRQPQPEAAAAFPPANVPAWLLLESDQQHGDGTSSRSLTVFDPQDGQARFLPNNTPIDIAAGADEVHFSPDGYQMVLFREDADESGLHYYLTSYSTESLGRQWDTEILTIASDEDSEPDPFSSASHIPVRLTSAITNNRVYAALLTTDTEPRIEIQSFFRRNGMPRGSIEIDLPGQTPDTRVFRGKILLHAPQGSERLYLLVESFGDSSEEWRATLMTFDTTDLSLVSERSISADPNQGYWLWDSKMTSDGSALFGVHENRSANQVRVQFLDLQSGDLTSLQLPFDTSANRLEAVLSVPSHDGKRMYVLDRDATSVAVVNLIEREIERVFPLDHDSFAGQIPPVPEDQLFGAGTALSADGSQLFVGSTDNRGMDGVWVIDTSLWALAGFVPLEGLVGGIFLSPAEDAIYAQLWTSPFSSPELDLVKISTADQPAVVEAIDVPQSADGYVALRSPWHHFQTQYGRSPDVDYQPLTDLSEFSTLPRIEVQTDPAAIAAGQNVTMEVRMVDPASGEPLDGLRPDVRFDPQTSLTATLRSDGQAAQYVILGATQPGVYRGTLGLPATGTWNIDVTLTGGDGTTVLREGLSQIEVSPSFSGSDGRNYAFRLVSTPEQPTTSEDVVLSLALIDIDSEELLPDNVTVEIIYDGVTVQGLPERLDIALTHDDAGFLTARMQAVGQGVYHGDVRFWTSGAWTARIRMESDTGVQISMPANVIDVSTP